ncbi:MAG: hypothetical protein IT427_00150 [Pirellulales bacterium]|nr:hypothetical protein [Pirellulales bacterium]
MPGSARCARCGGLLAFASEAINVHPPRTTSWGKSFQGLWRFIFLGRRIWETIRTEIRWNRIGVSDAPRFDLPTVLRGMVPGWANIHTGHKLRGYLFLASYILIALPAIAMLGTQFGATLLGIAFGIHAVSIVTALVPVFATYRDRLIFTGICGLALAFIVYLPVGMALSLIATPLNVNQNMPPFTAGEVVWYHPTSSVRPGQYALYDSTGVDTAMRAAGGQHVRFIAVAGLRINRVIATEGQTLKWDQGQMLIDDNPTARSSVFPDNRAVHQSCTVPSGHVLIDPWNIVPGGIPGGRITVHGVAVPINLQLGDAIWQNLAVVPVQRLRGVVFWRSWPMSQAGFLN